MRLDRIVAAVAGVGAFALLGGVYFAVRRSRSAAGEDDPDVTDAIKEDVQRVVGKRVLGREYAAGASQPLVDFMDWWDVNGTHVIRVAHGTYGGHAYVGGIRDLAQQLSDAAAGLSKATSADTAPHMHGGALDFWPVGFVPNRSFDEQPDGKGALYEQQMRALGAEAKSQGLDWGGDWGDLPHLQDPAWQGLPVGGVIVTPLVADNAAPTEEES